MARVLVACEFSGVVRQAFRERGHDAWSCDLLPAEDESPYHYQDDVVNVMSDWWDMMIAFPPPMNLDASGTGWLRDRRKEQEEAIELVGNLLDAPIPYIALENSISVIGARVRSPSQTIQPYWFGHPETKATRLWLKGLPLLRPMNNMKQLMDTLTRREKRDVRYAPPGEKQSRTLTGIANAMADQWGEYVNSQMGMREAGEDERHPNEDEYGA